MNLSYKTNQIIYVKVTSTELQYREIRGFSSSILIATATNCRDRTIC